MFPHLGVCIMAGRWSLIVLQSVVSVVGNCWRKCWLYLGVDEEQSLHSSHKMIPGNAILTKL